MKCLLMLVVVMLITCLTVPVAAESITYTGKLATELGSGVDGLLVAQGLWATAGVSWLEWVVTHPGSGPWNYQYTLSVPHADISHMIVEASPEFTMADIFGTSPENMVVEVGTFSRDVDIPGSIHGIKFEEFYPESTHITVSFSSYRQPVWGDFYAKDGLVGGTWNVLWNKGFGTEDQELNDSDYIDPTDLPSNGSIRNHVIVPDTIIPEPGSLLALATGVVGMAGLVVRRRRII